VFGSSTAQAMTGDSEQLESEVGESPPSAPKPWSVYDAIPDDWSALSEDLDRWKQGDVVADVPVTWLMPPGADPVTEMWSPSASDIVPMSAPQHLGMAIVCTQTCDLGAAPPGDKHPYVLLAPLLLERQIPSRAMARLAREGRVGYLVRTSVPAADSERWYADLRLMFPASKAVLLGRTPIEGFASEADSLAFGEIIAQKFRRPALSETLSESLPRALEQFVRDNGPQHLALAGVEQVRLLVLEGVRLNPTRAQLIVLADQVLPGEHRVVWERFQKTASQIFKTVGIMTAPMIFESPHSLNAHTYRLSVPVSGIGVTRWP
jgi:hypothetical protein